MGAKWVRAAFMILLGLVLLLYGGGFVTDLETHSSTEWNMSFEWTWDLLNYLIWILIAWLFVYAALTIVLSLRADAYTLGDVMARLDGIEKRLGQEAPRPSVRREREKSAAPVATDEDEMPPPPRE